MSIDLDALDGIFPEHVAKSSKVGGSFPPKAKPRPRNKNSIKPCSAQSARNTSIADNETKNALGNNLDSVSDVHFVDTFVEKHPVAAPLAENIGTDVVSANANQKPAAKNADVVLGLELFDDISSQAMTAAVGVSSGPIDKIASEKGDIVEGSLDPPVSTIEGLTVEASNHSSTQTCPADHVTLHALTRDEVFVSDSDEGFHFNNGVLEIKEVGTGPFTENLGQGSKKIQPKPKLQAGPRKIGTNTTHPDGSGSVPCSSHDYAFLGSDDCASEFLPNNQTSQAEELFNNAFDSRDQPVDVFETVEKASQSAELGERSIPTGSDDFLEHQQASISGQVDEAGISTRSLRKRINKCALFDEDEDEHEAYDVGNFANGCPSGSPVDGDDSGDSEYQVEKETPKEKMSKESRKSSSQKEKRVRKRKNVHEAPDQTTKKPRKKFSHSTRRSKRRVDKVLLETPEDDIDLRKLRIRDIILLAEHREWVASKEGKNTPAPPANQSAGLSFADHNEDCDEYGDFASEGGQFCKDRTAPVAQESSTYINYHSHMKKTPRARWSKQDTELFYEGVHQFGSDISMIQQLFPGRTREQVKLKYKKEERQEPFRLHDALTNRGKDHSHFQRVIEQLQQLAAQEKLNSFDDVSNDLTGNGEEANLEINEEVVKPDVEKAEAMEPDPPPEVESPVKSSYDSDDDLGAWSQYKSEL